MTDDRADLALTQFERALATLAETLALPESRAVRDSLLLRYVYTFEMAWRALLHALHARGDRETPAVAYEVLRTAFKLRLVTDADLWQALREARNAVVHAYDERQAVALAALVRERAPAEFGRLLRALRAAQ